MDAITIDPKQDPARDNAYRLHISELGDVMLQQLLVINRDIEIVRRYSPEHVNNLRTFMTELVKSFIEGNQIFTSIHSYFIDKLKSTSITKHPFNPTRLSRLRKSLKRLCNVICLGDSNTFNFQQDDWRMYVSETYPAHLMQLFRENEYSFNILNCGFPGATVRQYRESLKGNILNVEPAYGASVTILALGLNDIGHGLEREEPFDKIKGDIVSGLDKICDDIPLSFSHETKIYLCSVPAFNPDYLESTQLTQEQISGLNNSIKEMCEDRKIAYISLDGMLAKEDYSDFLHLNRSGQIKFAKAVFDSIKGRIDYIRAYNKFKI